MRSRGRRHPCRRFEATSVYTSRSCHTPAFDKAHASLRLVSVSASFSFYGAYCGSRVSGAGVAWRVLQGGRGLADAGGDGLARLQPAAGADRGRLLGADAQALPIVAPTRVHLVLGREARTVALSREAGAGARAQQRTEASAAHA
eukprot:6178660-Pleurochrysis_carterae.AAC.3